eukprot:985147_1
MADSKDDNEEKGWVKVEEYAPPKNMKVIKPDKVIKVAKNDKVLLQIQKVTLLSGQVIADEPHDMRVWCCDDDPDIKGLSEGIKNQSLGKFLKIQCSPTWGYSKNKRQELGIDDNAVLVFFVWIKEVDPYLKH